MRVLYHFPLSPFSRKIRIILKEKELDFELIPENYWERRQEFLALSPSGEVPVLVENDELVLHDSIAIAEFLEESYREKPMLPPNTKDRAETRAIANWFDNKFYNEVTRYIFNEKILKFYKGSGEPNSEAIRAGKANIHSHLDYISYLLRKRKWLAGDEFSLADITACAHLSVLDYLGDVPWQHSDSAKDWYSVVKSRPSFRPLLSDRLMGFKPVKHYADLDF